MASRWLRLRAFMIASDNIRDQFKKTDCFTDAIFKIWPVVIEVADLSQLPVATWVQIRTRHAH